MKYFTKLELAIKKLIPEAIVLKNRIPKTYVDFDLYNNLVNNDNTENTFDLLPRVGSFEVSYKGFLIFSKLGGDYWPNINLVAQKCSIVAEHEPHCCDFRDYLAGMSITKDGTCQPSTSVIRIPRKVTNIVEQRNHEEFSIESM